MPVDDIDAVLAAAHNQIAEMQSQVERLVNLVSVLEARVYCIEVSDGLRQSGQFGLDGLRFCAGTSIQTLQGYRERVLAALRGDPQ